jgi:2-dehydropantoate 2-reductase
MRIAVVGAGAMGGSYGGMLAVAGEDVGLLDARSDHVAAIRADGLRVSGAFGEHVVRLPAAESPEGLEPAEGAWADLVIVFTDTNATGEAARAADHLLSSEGCAITFQNGIGNVETLQAKLGAERVLGGSSMCSALVEAPGHVVMTHRGPTSIGELDGRRTNRLQRVAGALERAGFEVEVKDDINARIWTKFIINSAINALCATTGLRLGEVGRLDEMDVLQDRILDEAFALVRAKEIPIAEADVRAGIKRSCRLKFSRPSMLQHVEAGRRTEIDAINGALVRESRKLGLAAPYNEALTALLKGRERDAIRRRERPDLDYDAWEAEVAAEEEQQAGA